VNDSKHCGHLGTRVRGSAKCEQQCCRSAGYEIPPLVPQWPTVAEPAPTRESNEPIFSPLPDKRAVLQLEPLTLVAFKRAHWGGSFLSFVLMNNFSWLFFRNARRACASLGLRSAALPPLGGAFRLCDPAQLRSLWTQALSWWLSASLESTGVGIEVRRAQP